MNSYAAHQCTSKSPKTGRQCRMALGHCGPHRVGKHIEHPLEEWVTPCSDRKCDFHEHYVGPQVCEIEGCTRHTGKARKPWAECIHCGATREVGGPTCPRCGTGYAENKRGFGWRQVCDCREEASDHSHAPWAPGVSCHECGEPYAMQPDDDGWLAHQCCKCEG